MIPPKRHRGCAALSSAMSIDMAPGAQLSRAISIDMPPGAQLSRAMSIDMAPGAQLSRAMSIDMAPGAQLSRAMSIDMAPGTQLSRAMSIDMAPRRSRVFFRQRIGVAADVATRAECHVNGHGTGAQLIPTSTPNTIFQSQFSLIRPRHMYNTLSNNAHSLHSPCQ